MYLLQVALPSRFQTSIQVCLDSLDAIMSLPMVLEYQDLFSCNIMVDESTCHLVSVIDWAEAEICPSGFNLCSLQVITGKLHLRDSWTRYEDYDALQKTFWERFEQEVGGLSGQQIHAIKMARVLGVLLRYRFTRRLANEP